MHSADLMSIPSVRQTGVSDGGGGATRWSTSCTMQKEKVASIYSPRLPPFWPSFFFFFSFFVLVFIVTSSFFSLPLSYSPPPGNHEVRLVGRLVGLFGGQCPGMYTPP